MSLQQKLRGILFKINPYFAARIINHLEYVNLQNANKLKYKGFSMNEIKKIKVVMVASKLDITGVSTVIMNYCNNIDKDKFSISIIAGKPVTDSYLNIAKESNVDVIELPNKRDNLFKYYLCLFKELKQGKYDIVHVHGNSAIMSLELMVAKMAGIKCRIAHSHNSTCSNLKLHKILYSFFNRLYMKGFACSTIAGDWLYKNKNYEVLENGFVTSDFCFSEDLRNKIRKQLNCENKFVIGHIGRFNDQKNQEFLLEIFKSIGLKRKNAVLLLVGAGPKYEEIKMKIDEHPFKNRIIMYGETENPAEIYNAMDIFILPSLYEGLPVVGIEAQANGLRCIFSDNITDETKLYEKTLFLPIESPEVWSNTIIKCINDCSHNIDDYTLLHEKYDISKLSDSLYKKYVELLKEKDN